jgi:curved DNA-binding protein CbpA
LTLVPQKATFGSDPHRVLGLRPGADEAEIKLAFRRLALRHHPDVAGETHRGTFEAIRSAYDVLLHRRRSPDATPAGTSRFGRGNEEPASPEEQQHRVRSQLEGLQHRAAVRQRREHEKEHRAALRTHATRGAMSGRAGSAHERLEEQLSQLPQRNAHDAMDADGSHAVSGPIAMLPSARLVHDAIPPPHDAESDSDVQRLVRLARLARFWRDTTGWGDPDSSEVASHDTAERRAL